MEIIRPHPPSRAPIARLGILMMALIVLVAGLARAKRARFSGF